MLTKGCLGSWSAFLREMKLSLEVSPKASKDLTHSAARALQFVCQSYSAVEGCVGFCIHLTYWKAECERAVLCVAKRLDMPFAEFRAEESITAPYFLMMADSASQ